MGAYYTYCTVIYTQLGRTGLKVSRIGLGTAEIGFAYGIGDRAVPTQAQASMLLRGAADLGITFFDTANAYGLSEERIGKSGILKNPEIIVETKCAQFLEKGESVDRQELEKRIRDQVAISLKVLQVESLPILMLHGPSKEQIEKGDLIEIFSSLKKEGLIRFTGVSTRGIDAPHAAIASDFFDVVQVSYSIADQRISEMILPFALEKNVGVVSRSTLLKGAFTPLHGNLHAGLTGLKKCVSEAEMIATSLGIDLPTLAIRFAISNQDISTSLVGSNKIANIGNAIKALEAGPLPKEIVAQLAALAVSDVDQIDPARWPKN